MKRIFTAIFLILSLLAFTGCGGGGMKSKAGTSISPFGGSARRSIPRTPGTAGR